MTSMPKAEFAFLRAQMTATIAAGVEAGTAGEVFEPIQSLANRAIAIADAILERCELRGRT